jgi:hypothetical protein
MKLFNSLLLYILLFILVALFGAGCSAQTSPAASAPAEDVSSVAGESASEDSDDDAAADATAVLSADTADPAESDPIDLPLLPVFWQNNTTGVSEELPGGPEDPFVGAAFTLATTLPQKIESAVVQRHSFRPLEESEARMLAGKFGFSGPLYLQRIPPEFAPPEGEESPVYTAFDGRRILTISHTGLFLEDRGVQVDYMDLPSYSEKESLIENQLNEWGLLDFTHEFRELPWGDLILHRLIDGVPTEQNEFQFLYNKEGELNIFSYQPFREISILGSYPLQSAEAAWEQVQSPEGRVTVHYQLSQPPSEGLQPVEVYVNPRSWTYSTDPGQELHLYMSPIVYEATDDGSLLIVFGDIFLTGDEQDLAQIADHLSDVLHVWGTVVENDSVKSLQVAGWEQTEMVGYEPLEGTITYENGQALLQTTGGETLILAAAPDDIPEGTAGYVGAAARRDIGADYPVIDWMSITEKIEWPEELLVTDGPNLDPEPIANVTVDSAELVYYTYYEANDSPNNDASMLFIPVWKFVGKTDQGDIATFWVPAVERSYTQSS